MARPEIIVAVAVAVLIIVLVLVLVMRKKDKHDGDEIDGPAGKIRIVNQSGLKLVHIFHSGNLVITQENGSVIAHYPVFNASAQALTQVTVQNATNSVAEYGAL